MMKRVATIGMAVFLFGCQTPSKNPTDPYQDQGSTSTTTGTTATITSSGATGLTYVKTDSTNQITVKVNAGDPSALTFNYSVNAGSIVGNGSNAIFTAPQASTNVLLTVSVSVGATPMLSLSTNVKIYKSYQGAQATNVFLSQYCLIVGNFSAPLITVAGGSEVVVSGSSVVFNGVFSAKGSAVIFFKSYGYPNYLEPSGGSVFSNCNIGSGVFFKISPNTWVERSTLSGEMGFYGGVGTNVFYNNHFNMSIYPSIQNGSTTIFSNNNYTHLFYNASYYSNDFIYVQNNITSSTFSLPTNAFHMIRNNITGSYTYAFSGGAKYILYGSGSANYIANNNGQSGADFTTTASVGPQWDIPNGTVQGAQSPTPISGAGANW